MKKLVLSLILSTAFTTNTLADERIGEVSTTFKLIGPDHKIIVEGFNDPKVEGIKCFISRAKTGGISGGLGLAEDTSDASVACRQVGKIKFNDEISFNKKGETVFKESTSLLFKKIQVVRFYDEDSNSLVYLVYSDKLVDGSLKNSISAVWLEDVYPPKWFLQKSKHYNCLLFIKLFFCNFVIFLISISLFEAILLSINSSK